MFYKKAGVKKFVVTSSIISVTGDLTLNYRANYGVEGTSLFLFSNCDLD